MCYTEQEAWTTFKEEVFYACVQISFFSHTHSVSLTLAHAAGSSPGWRSRSKTRLTSSSVCRFLSGIH